MDLSNRTISVVVFVCTVVLFTHMHAIYMQRSAFLKNNGQVNLVAENMTRTRIIPDFITYAHPYISLRHLLAVCVKAVQLGGIKLKEIRRKYDIGQYSEIRIVENSMSPVLLGFNHSSNAMYYVLKNYFPKIKIVSKKGYDKKYKLHDEELSDLQWMEFDDASEDIAVSVEDILVWLDPLDGSKYFNDNNLEYVTSMVCVAVKGKPVIGVIHQPFENVTMWGWDEKGISNDTFDNVSLQSDVSFPVIGVERMWADEFQNYVRLALGHDAYMMFNGGAGYKILQLALGNLDAYSHTASIKKWDLCAGNAIIKALHGNMSAFNGKPIDYGNHSEVTHEGGVYGTIYDAERYIDLTSSASNST